MTTVIGVDSSSTGIAWTAINEEGIHDFGKVNLTKYKEPYDRIKKIYEEWGNICDLHLPNIVIVEQSIFVSNPCTARVLSYIVGAVFATAIAHETEQVIDVSPQSWKCWLGYKNITKKFEAEVKSKMGTRDGSKFCNNLRKSQTYNVIKHNYPEFEIEDNDIADSCGIALYGWHNNVKKLSLEISHGIAVPQEPLASLGLSF